MPSMASQRGPPPFFSRPLGSEEAFEALSAINILVDRTEGTSDECYEGCLEYLRSSLSHLSVQELRATQPDYEPDLNERKRERYMLYVAPDNALSVAAEIDAAYITAQTVSRDILFPDVSSTAYVLGRTPKYSLVNEQARLAIRYIVDGSPYPLDPKLFHQAKIAAAIVVHDCDVISSDELQRIFKETSQRLQEIYAVEVVHMLCRSSRGFFIFDVPMLCSKYKWLKYSTRLQQIRVDTGVEGFSNHTISYSTANDTIVLYNSSSKIKYFLRELAIHCIVCIIRNFITTLETDKLSESSLMTEYDADDFIAAMSRKKHQQLIVARTHKIHGDILMMLSNWAQAMEHYYQAKTRCKAVNDPLYKGAAGLCLAIVLMHIAKLKKYGAYEARRSELASIPCQQINPRRSLNYKFKKAYGGSLRNDSDFMSHIGNAYVNPNTPTSQRKFFSLFKFSVKKTDSMSSNTLMYMTDDGLNDERFSVSADSYTHKRTGAYESSESLSSELDLERRKSLLGARHSHQPDKEAERILRTFTKSFLRWLGLARVPKYELELCLVIMLHYMRNQDYYMRLHFIITRILECSDRMLSLEEALSVLRYVIDFTASTPYARKWNYYKFLYAQKTLKAGLDPSADAVREIRNTFLARGTGAGDVKNKQSEMTDPESEMSHLDQEIHNPEPEATTATELGAEPSKGSIGTTLRENENQHVSCNIGTAPSLQEVEKQKNNLQWPCSPEAGSRLAEYMPPISADLRAILDEISGTISSSFRKPNRYKKNTTLRITKFPKIQDSYLELAIRQCESRHMHLEVAQLSCLQMITAIEQGLCQILFDEDHIQKVESYRNRFTRACNIVGREGKHWLFDFNHLILAEEIQSKLVALSMQRIRFSGNTAERHRTFRTLTTERSLLHHCGGYIKSHHPFPLLLAIDHMESRKSEDCVIHVKEPIGPLHGTRNHDAALQKSYVYKLKGVSVYRSHCVLRRDRYILEDEQDTSSVDSHSPMLATSDTEDSETGPPTGSLQHELKIGKTAGQSGIKEPCFVVINRITSRNAKCHIARSKRKLIARDSRRIDLKMPVVDASYHLKDDTTETKVELNSIQTVSVVLTNPVPLKLVLEEVSLLTVGAKVDIIRGHVTMEPMQQEVRIPIRFVPREVGALRIVGLSFSLFGSIRCNQVFLNVPVMTAASTMEEIASCPGVLPDKISSVIQEGGSLKFKVCPPVYRPMVSFYTAQLLCKKGEQACIHSGFTGSLDHQDSYSYHHLLSSVRSFTSIGTVNKTNLNDCWHAVRCTSHKLASVPQEVGICPEASCWACCTIRQHSRELTPVDSPDLEMIEGEERLIVLRVHNDSRDVSMTNLKVSVLPLLEVPDEPKQSLTRSDRELAIRKQRRRMKHMESKLLKNFTVCANRSTVYSDGVSQIDPCNLMGSPRSQYDYASCTPVDCAEPLTGLSVNPGSTMYVPIIYRASMLKGEYHICLDYEYGSDASKIRASIFKSIKLNVSRSVSIGKQGIAVRSAVQFSVDDLARNLSIPYQPGTLEALQVFRRIYDGQHIDVAVNIVNSTDKPFMCSSRGYASFVSMPQSDSLWELTASRLGYLEAKYMHPTSFLKALDRYMALQWAIDEAQCGELRISDLGQDTFGQQEASPKSQGREISVRDYRDAICSQRRRYTIWKHGTLGRYSSVSRIQRVPTAIAANLHNLVESKISLELTVSTRTASDESKIIRDQSGYNISVPVGVPFKVTVSSRNNSDVVVENFLTVIVPFIYGSYGEPKGLSYTGSLEQLSREPLAPAMQCSTYSFPSIVRRGIQMGAGTTVRNMGAPYEMGTNVAHIWIRAHDSLIYGITAAVIVKREGTVYWHHRPVVIHVVPS